MLRRCRFPGLLAITMTGLLAAAGPSWAGPGTPDRSVWDAVDIVPMPKRIGLSGRQVPLARGVIVLGAKPSPQDQIGAQWINDRVVRAGGQPLPVVNEPAGPPQLGLRIWIGTRDTCAAIDRAAAAGLFRLGPQEPGRRGYVICPHRQREQLDVYLGGADPIGALYACVTLAGLLEGYGQHLAIREAEVVDWPDYQMITEGWNLANPEIGSVAARFRNGSASAPQREEYLRAMREHIDRLLSWKISCFNADEMRNWQRFSPEFLATFREVAEYAKARGVHSLLYALSPAVGLRSDFPDVPERCLTGKGRDRYDQYVRCWSMDEPRRQTAARLGEFIAAAGLTDVGFHDWDTGGYLNPAQWEERCDVCRQRWGDDYAAATVNKHRIYYEEIKKRAPECRVHFTLYSYNIAILTQPSAEQYCIREYGPGGNVPETARRLRERYTDFWQRVSAGLPADVSFCIRESTADNVHRFHELVRPHGTFIWYKVGSEQWHAFFDESPRWGPTFFSGRDDVMFNVSLESFLPLKALTVTEYAWNTKAPGASGWSLLAPELRQEHAEARGEIYEVILPHVVRNLFGRQAAPELTQALSLNVAMNHVFDHLPQRRRATPVLTTAEKWQWQADEAQKGCRLLDRLFERFTSSGDRLGMSDYAVRRMVFIREVFHCCRAMAQAKAQNMLARETAKAGKLDEARAAVARGRQIIAEARQDMERLVAERPEDPIYNARLDRNKRPIHWKLYTPDNGVDFKVPEQLLAQTERELPALAAAGDLPEAVVELLAKRKVIHAGPTMAAPTIDGRLDEPEWQSAVPGEAFFAYPPGQGLARAQTRARFLYDDQALYLGVTCWLPGGELPKAKVRPRDGAVQEDEGVELFLVPPHLGGGYVQFQINAAGSLADKRVMFSKNKAGTLTRTKDPKWDAEGLVCKTSQQPGRWELEARLPLAALGAKDRNGTWRAAVCRDYKGPTRELSMLMRPAAKDFHDTGAMLQLLRSPEPAPAPQVELAVAGLKRQTKTLDDRVATVLSFVVEARSNRVLHDASCAAELYDASGRMHRRVTLQQLAHLPYFWRSGQEFSAAFDQEVPASGMRLVLEAGPARCEHWVRFGGWEGAGEKGRVFLATDRAATTGQGLCLQAPCNLPAEMLPRGATQAERLLDRRHGTIEFWFRPDWPADHPAEVQSPWHPRHVLLHCGTLRRDYPQMFNCSAVTVFYDTAGHSLRFQVSNRQYASWNVACQDADGRLGRKPAWHHLACVWDHDAPADDMLRMYLDGIRVTGPVQLGKAERLGDDKRIELDKPVFALQLGCLNTGRCPAGALLAELRISRTARYKKDFPPPTEPAKLDPATAALFHFDGSLRGEGETTQGTRYEIQARPGVLEYH